MEWEGFKKDTVMEEGRKEKKERNKEKKYNVTYHWNFIGTILHFAYARVVSCLWSSLVLCRIKDALHHSLSTNINDESARCSVELAWTIVSNFINSNYSNHNGRLYHTISYISGYLLQLFFTSLSLLLPFLLNKLLRNAPWGDRNTHSFLEALIFASHLCICWQHFWSLPSPPSLPHSTRPEKIQHHFPHVHQSEVQAYPAYATIKQRLDIKPQFSDMFSSSPRLPKRHQHVIEASSVRCWRPIAMCSLWMGMSSCFTLNLYRLLILAL